MNIAQNTLTYCPALCVFSNTNSLYSVRCCSLHSPLTAMLMCREKTLLYSIFLLWNHSSCYFFLKKELACRARRADCCWKRTSDLKSWGAISTTGKTPKRNHADQMFGSLLVVTTNLTQSNGSMTVFVRLHYASSGRSSLASCLGGCKLVLTTTRSPLLLAVDYY